MWYSIYSTFTRFSALNIDNIGISDETNVTHYGPTQSRSSYVIFYVVNGKGYFNGNLVLKGQGFIHDSYAFEEYYPDPDDPWTLLWFATDDSAMGAMLKYCNADKETCIFDCDLTPVLPSLMETFEKHNKKKLNRAEMLEIFMKIFKISLDVPLNWKYERSERAYVNHAVKYIQSNYHTNITVSDLTAHLGISQPYLFKIFKKFFNKSPKQYIISYRIEQAKKLLDETSLSLSEVAQSVGYDDYFAFSKVFTEKTKQSPREFRNRFIKRGIDMNKSGK